MKHKYKKAKGKSNKIILTDEYIRDAIIATACHAFIDDKLGAHGLLSVVLYSCKGTDALQRLMHKK